MTTAHTRFWELVRAYEPYLYLLLILNLVLLLLAVFAVPFVDMSTATGVILLIDFVLCLAVLLPTLYLIYRVREIRDRERQL